MSPKYVYVNYTPLHAQACFGTKPDRDFSQPWLKASITQTMYTMSAEGLCAAQFLILTHPCIVGIM